MSPDQNSLPTFEVGFIFDGVASPVLALSPDWKILYCNQAYADFVTIPVKDLTGQNLLEILPEFASRPSFDKYQLALDTGKVQIVEGKTPGNRFLRAQIIPVSWGIIAIAEDVTEVRQSQAALAENEKRYRTLFEASSDAIFLETETGEILDCNSKACEMYGYAKNEILQMNVRQLVPEYEEHKLEQITEDVKKPGSRILEIFNQRKDGSQFPVEISYRRVNFDGIRGYVVYVRDVSERKRAELALRESERKFRSFVQQSTDGVVLVDEEGLIIEWNRGQEQITGISRAQAIGRHIWDLQFELAPPERRNEALFAKTRANTLQMLQTGENAWGDEVLPQSILLPDGTLRYVEARSFPIPTDRSFMVGSVIRDVTENTKLESDLRRRIEEGETLRQAMAALTTTLNLDEVLESILIQLERVISVDSAAVFLLEGDKLVGVAGRGSLRFDQLIGKRFPASNPLLAEVGRRKYPKILEDAQQSPHFEKWADTSYVHGWMGIPLILRGDVIGFLTCDSARVGTYTESDATLAVAFANQAAVAIANARSLEAERKQLILAQTLQEVGALLTSQLGLQEVLERILDLLARVVHYDSVSINLIREGNTLELAAGRGCTDIDAVRNIIRGLSTHILIRKHGHLETWVIPDTQNSDLWIHFAEAGPIRSYIGAPLEVKGRLIGVLNVDSWTPGQYDEAIAQTVTAFANQAAIAIENAHLYEQAAAERRHLSLLYNLGREVGASLDPDRILERAIHLTCQVFKGKVGQAFLYDPDEDRLIIRAVYGEEKVRQNALRVHHTQRPWIGLTGWVAEHNQAVYVPDVSQDQRWVQVPGIDDDVVSALCAPIIFDENLLGVISIHHRLKDAFSTDHLDLIQAICQQIGLALSNARRYQQTQQRLSEILFIQSMSQTFNKRVSKQELLEEIVSQLAVRGGYPDVRIYLVEENKLILAASRGLYTTSTETNFCRQMAVKALQEGSSQLVPDVRTYIQDPGADFRMASFLAVPIFRENSPIGVLQVSGEHPHQITAHDRELLVLLSGQISVALENAVLYDHIRNHADELERTVAQKTSELTALYKLSQEIGYQISFEALLNLVLDHLIHAITSDVVAGCLLMDNNDTLVVSAARPLSEQAEHQVREAYNYLIQDYGTPVQALDKITFRPIAEFCEPCPTILKLNSLISVPVLVENRLAGVLIVASERKSSFGPEEMRLLTTFANQASTAAQRLHALLTAQQKHLENIFAHMPVGVLLVDENQNLLSSNPLGREILRALNSDQADDIPADTRFEHLGPISFENLIDLQDDHLPFTISIEDSLPRTFETQVRPVGVEDRRQWVITLREVTQERENQARIQSQERLATVGQLAAGIAHDFNNIMAAILVYADLLRNDPALPDPSREKVIIIQQQVQRAASLIRQILDFSRRSVMEQSLLNLLPFIKELDKLLGRVLPETIELQLNYAPGAYYVNADPTRLQQVFMNLALNARDAMPTGGTLRFELRREFVSSTGNAPVPDMPPGEWIRIAVSDTGHGISPEVRDHIFEPFYTTKPVGQGTGLGLAQVYGIIKQHEGFVNVRSQPGEGATFILYLPALEIGKTGELIPLDTEPNTGAEEMILVVEDDPATRQAIRVLLETHNYRVLTAPDGQTALETFAASGDEIVLVISDLVMPRMGGLELYNAIRTTNQQIKFLFITGHPLEGEYQSLLEKGGVDWLQKPFSVQTLTRAVRQQLQR